MFIPIPRIKNTHISITINDEEVKSLVDSSTWIRPLMSISLGAFTLKLKNASGKLRNKYKKGDIVKFFADNVDGTTLKFHGRIDYPRDILTETGHFLEIHGRHRSFILNETLVNHSTNGVPTDTGQILRDIMDKYAPNFTQNNIEDSGILIEIEWNYIPFPDCVQTLTSRGNADAYVDNDLDMNYFKKNSKTTNDWVVEGINQIRTDEIGVDDFYEKTRVIATGFDDEGIPIVFTAISPGEGEIREVKIADSSASTLAEVQALAEGELANLLDRQEQSVIKSQGLDTINQGDRMWVVIKRQDVYGRKRIVQITDKFGKASWISECMVEIDTRGTEELINDRIKNENRTNTVDNINKFDFTYNFRYDNDDLTLTHSDTLINDGNLELKSGSSEGRWESRIKEIPSDVTEVELRYKGKDLGISKFFFRLDGDKWQQFTRRILVTPSETTGRSLQLRVDLKSDTLNSGPSVGSAAIGYSF